MDYENMSDFEINKRVADSRWPEFVKYEQYGKLRIQVPDGDDFYFDFNDPADAWPIITSNAIDIEFAVDSLGGIGQAHVYVEGDTDLECNFNDNSKALRAAMIVYLMMQEAKC